MGCCSNFDGRRLSSCIFFPHQLAGRYAGLWECHIEDDWLLIWRQDDRQLTLLLTDTGTHLDLFGKKGINHE